MTMNTMTMNTINSIHTIIDELPLVEIIKFLPPRFRLVSREWNHLWCYIIRNNLNITKLLNIDTARYIVENFGIDQCRFSAIMMEIEVPGHVLGNMSERPIEIIKALYYYCIKQNSRIVNLILKGLIVNPSYLYLLIDLIANIEDAKIIGKQLFASKIIDGVYESFIHTWPILDMIIVYKNKYHKETVNHLIAQLNRDDYMTIEPNDLPTETRILDVIQNNGQIDTIEYLLGKCKTIDYMIWETWLNNSFSHSRYQIIDLIISLRPHAKIRKERDILLLTHNKFVTYEQVVEIITHFNCISVNEKVIIRECIKQKNNKIIEHVHLSADEFSLAVEHENVFAINKILDENDLFVIPDDVYLRINDNTPVNIIRSIVMYPTTDLSRISIEYIVLCNSNDNFLRMIVDPRMLLNVDITQYKTLSLTCSDMKSDQKVKFIKLFNNTFYRQRK